MQQHTNFLRGHEQTHASLLVRKFRNKLKLGGQGGCVHVAPKIF